MFDKLKSLLQPQKPKAAPPAALNVAVAALLVEAARADESYSDREKSLIDKALSDRFGLAPCCAADLRAEGEAAQENANDLHTFTKVAKEMPAEEKLALIESLWRVVLSDGARDPHEDALIRRICGLIYVADPESAAARNRAANALNP